MLSVSGTDETDHVWNGSNDAFDGNGRVGGDTGPCVNMFAPGDQDVSNVPGPGSPVLNTVYCTPVAGNAYAAACSGNSPATALVSGAAALYLQNYPTASSENVVYTLESVATKNVVSNYGAYPTQALTAALNLLLNGGARECSARSSGQRIRH